MTPGEWIAAATLALAFVAAIGGCVAWLIGRFDKRFDAHESVLATQFSNLYTEVDGERKQRQKLEKRVDQAFGFLEGTGHLPSGKFQAIKEDSTDPVNPPHVSHLRNRGAA